LILSESPSLTDHSSCI